MTNFDDIRPYNDDEVRETIDRLIVNPNFQLALGRLNYPKLARFFPIVLRWAVGRFLRHETEGVNSIFDVQKIVEKYMTKMISRAVTQLSCSGLEKLQPGSAYLFVSNHRDISMDPAFVNYVLFQHGFQTVRIAIGDNLLSIPFASDLMRLNKSFIVSRSAKTNREKFAASKHLSEYIHHSINVDNEHIWIAQRQGRAKDGLDRTESAVISMFVINRPKAQNFADYIRELHIVPVSLSYEWDPLDVAKARELYAVKTSGCYHKQAHEDVFNLAKGIAGVKGYVHVAFGDMLTRDFNSKDEVVAELDHQIIRNCVFNPSNCFAYQRLYDSVPAVTIRDTGKFFDPQDFPEEAAQFDQRLRAIEEKYRPFLLQMYANPVVSRLQLDQPLAEQKLA